MKSNRRPGHGREVRLPLIIVAIILVAVNLRLAITSAASLLTLLEESGALTPATMVVIPAIPTAVFALAGVSTGRLAIRFGIERTVAAGMLVLTAGLMVRAIEAPWAVVLGTIVATSGLAVVNILLPAVARSYFGMHIGPITTVYTTAMSLGSATAAAVAVPIASAVGSPSLGLAAWSIPALLGFIVWMLVVPLKPSHRAVQVLTETGSLQTAAKPGAYPAGTMLLAGYFAMQALLSYVLMGWLPAIAADSGLPVERAGVLLGIAMIVGVPATALVIYLTRGLVLMRIGFILIAVSGVVGILGMLLAPAAMPEVWAVILGLGLSGFPVALTIIARIGANAVESARVSTLVQSSGYTVATVGPLGAGALRQINGSWSAVLIILVICVIVQGVLGLLITRKITVTR